MKIIFEFECRSDIIFSTYSQTCIKSHLWDKEIVAL